MKRTIIGFLFVVLISGLVSADVSAQSSTSSSAISTTSTKLSKLEQRNEKIRNFSAQMQERLNVIVGNLERMVTRAEVHIDKLAQENTTSTANFSAAKAKLDSAKNKITEVKTAISNLAGNVENVLNSKNSRTAFYTIREKMIKTDIVAKIKVIHKELLDSVKLAKKEIVRINAQNATSTQDVSDWKTYKNEKHNFYFRYPKGTGVSPISTPDKIIISETNSDGQNAGHWIYSVYIRNNDNNLTLEQATNLIREELIKLLEPGKNFLLSEITVDGMLVKKYLITNSSDYGNVGIVLIIGKNIINITGDTSNDFSEFVNSFKF